MAHDPKAVANWFIERGIKEDNPLTHIEVQKLLYFSHSWMLAIHEAPLHHGAWEAWRYGPVLPEIYFNLNWHRGLPITDCIPAPDESFTDEELAIMEGVYRYRSLGPFTLVGISHALGDANEYLLQIHIKGLSPWSEYRTRWEGRGSACGTAGRDRTSSPIK